MADQLYLVNNHDTDLTINLAKFRSVRATTLRRDRQTPISLTLPANTTKEMCSFLGVDKKEALAILEASADVKYFRNKGRMLTLYDPSEKKVKAGEASQTPTPEVAAHQEAPVVEKPISDPPRTSDSVGVTPGIEKSALDFLRIDPVTGERNMTPGLADAPPKAKADDLKEEEAVQKDSTKGAKVAASEDRTLDPGMMNVLPDTVPSYKWSTERLTDEAKKRGIETKGLSKNQILRKLRGLN